MGRKREGPKDIDSILDVAAQVFDEKGFHGATMQEIADAADLTKGGVYHYLTGKEDTLRLINERYLRRGLEEVQNLAFDEQRSLRERIEGVILAITEQHDRYSPDLRVTLREFGYLTGEHRQEVIALRDKFEGVVERLLDEADQEGLLIDSDVPLVTKFLFGSLNWMCMWYRKAEREPAAEIGRKFSAWIVSSILVTEPLHPDKYLADRR